MKSIDEILKDRIATTKEALEVFDSLGIATMDFMIGRWNGYEIATNHKMDGLLIASGWYGKLFVNAEEVHPLLFYTGNKTELYSVNPRIVPMQMNFPKSIPLGSIMKLVKSVLQTKKSTARLRMVEYRNKVTATMCYDEKAILDHFAKIDKNTVLGVMDMKGSERPYIFVLERDNDSDFKQSF